MSDVLHKQIAQYHQLGKQEALIREKRERLNKEIKKKLVGMTQAKPNEHIQYYGAPGYNVTLQIRRPSPKVDEAEAARVLNERGVFDRALSEQIDHTLIEQLFLNGELTDSDMRRIRGQTRKPTLALEVEEKEEEPVNVQG